MFLSKDELDTAEHCASERIRERYEDVSGRFGEMMGRRTTEVKDDLTRDPGLCWLYEGDVTFVDCSSSTSNRVNTHTQS